MKQDITEIEINGMKYVLKDSITQTSPVAKNAVIIRTQNAGVFFGEVVETQLSLAIVKLKNVRRLWFWAGAASLSQLAMEGTKKPGECKFPCAINEITLFGVLEVIPCTEAAVTSINAVKVWQL